MIGHEGDGGWWGSEVAVGLGQKFPQNIPEDGGLARLRMDPDEGWRGNLRGWARFHTREEPDCAVPRAKSAALVCPGKANHIFSLATLNESFF